VFESVTVWLADVLTIWFPKPTAVGVTLIEGEDAVTPAPVRLIVRGVLLALLLIEMVAEAVPVVVGLKKTVKVVLILAGRVIGTVSPDMLKPVPLIVACEITRSVALVLDSFIVSLVCVLTLTSPKLTSDGVMLIEGFAAGEDPLLVRAQLASEKIQAIHAITSRTMWAGRLDAAFNFRPIPEHSPPAFFHLPNPD
jgi:hypothetical protein